MISLCQISEESRPLYRVSLGALSGKHIKQSIHATRCTNKYLILLISQASDYSLSHDSEVIGQEYDFKQPGSINL